MNEKRPMVIKGSRIYRERTSQDNSNSAETRLAKYEPQERSFFPNDSSTKESFINYERLPDSTGHFYKPSGVTYRRSPIKPRSTSRSHVSRNLRQDTSEDGSYESTGDIEIFNRSQSRLVYPRATVEHVPRSSQAGYYSSKIPKSSKSTTKTNKLIKQIGIAVIILLIILLLNMIRLPFAQKLVSYVKVALTEDFDFDEALGKLKFVGDYLPDIKEVFNPKGEPIVFNVPTSGEVIRRFDEHVVLEDGDGFNSEGIDISTEKNADFFASADGKIASIENHDVYGQSLWIEHSDNAFSFYGGYDEITVKKGQSVKGGEKLGSLKESGSEGSILHFQIWIDEEPVDPLTILNMGSKASGQEGV